MLLFPHVWKQEIRWEAILPRSAIVCTCHTQIPTWLFLTSMANTHVLSKRDHKAIQSLDSAPIQVMHDLFPLVKQPIHSWAHVVLVRLSQYALLRFSFQALLWELIRNTVCFPSVPQKQLLYLTTLWYCAIPWLSNVTKKKKKNHDDIHG